MKSMELGELPRFRLGGLLRGFWPVAVRCAIGAAGVLIAWSAAGGPIVAI